MALWSRILNWFIYFIILALLFRALGGIVRIVMYIVPPRQKCATSNLFAKNRAEASKELIKYNRIASDILNNWDVVRGEWVPLLPFAMKIGSELYHPAHGGDERPRSGSYTRAVNGCFDPKCCEKKE